MSTYLKRVVDYRERSKESDGDFCSALPTRFFEYTKKNSKQLSAGDYILFTVTGKPISEHSSVDLSKEGVWAQKCPDKGGVRYVVATRHPYSGENRLVGYRVDSDKNTPLSDIGLEDIKRLTDVARDVEYLLEDAFEFEVVEFDSEFIITGIFELPRTTLANAHFMHDMAISGLLSGRDAVMRLSAVDVPGLLKPQFKLKHATVCFKGTPACAGSVTGNLVQSSSEVDDSGNCILLVGMTTPEDVAQMVKCKAIITTTGGLTSHAAVIARGHGIPCIVSVKAVTDFSGTVVSVDGATGSVYEGELPLVESDVADKISTILDWAAEEAEEVVVYCNADNANQIKEAVKSGAKGVGLIRTEHMLFTEKATKAFRAYILGSKSQKTKALSSLKSIQLNDFKQIFKVTAKKGNPIPVTIRLFDPPAHEFLPIDAEALSALASDLGCTFDSICHKTDSLREQNPMLGHRGIRLGITNPELYSMQASAIVEAAVAIVKANKGCKVSFGIMLPLVSHETEFGVMATLVRAIVTTVLTENGYPKNNSTIKFQVGAMLETPRACLIAPELVTAGAEFFSFGTNDLTQMTFGFSRDDTEGFMGKYIESGYLHDDPFAVLDDKGVARLLKIAMQSVRKSTPKIKFGICGEHGGDPASITKALRLGTDYVSCSPSRVPVALLASAQTIIADEDSNV